MRIGFINYWFNRGQAVIARGLREDFEARGHETYVFARLTAEKFSKPLHVRADGVWDQDRVTRASGPEPSDEEILAWARAAKLDVVHCDQFYQFNALERLRAEGVAVVGRFVWESFASEHVEAATRAMDIIYSFTRCEQERYAGFGIDSPYVPYGVRKLPERYTTLEKYPHTTFFYSGGFLSRRKPNGAVIEAFLRTKNPDIRLLIKNQRPFRLTDFVDAGEQKDLKSRNRLEALYDWAEQAVEDVTSLDPRISLVTDDVEEDEHFEMFSRSHVCFMPSRWEGLGLHLFESMALGIPLLVNDIPPINEVVTDGKNGILVPSRRLGEMRSGIPSYEPEVAPMTEALEALADPELRARLAEGARVHAEKLSWETTLDGLEALFHRAREGAAAPVHG